MSREGEPDYFAAYAERNQGERKRAMPTDELKPNSAQLIDAAELRDLQKRIDAPVNLSPAVKTKVQGNRNTAPKGKPFRRALWKDELQRSWSLKKGGPAK